MNREAAILLVLGCFLAGLVIGTVWTLKKQNRVFLVVLLLLPSALQAQVPTSFHGSSNGWGLQPDKRKHAAAGAVVSLAAMTVADQLGYKSPWWHGIAWAFIAGIAKELHDRHHGGRPEWSDATYTGAGGVAVAIPIRSVILRRRVEFAAAPPAMPDMKSNEP